MPARSVKQSIAARIAKAVKTGKARAMPGSPSAKMATGMSMRQLGHFTHTGKKGKRGS